MQEVKGPPLGTMSLQRGKSRGCPLEALSSPPRMLLSEAHGRPTPPTRSELQD